MNKSSISITFIIITTLITACAPSSPMEIDLEILQDPIVGREVDLSIVLSSSSDAPNTSLEIIIPEGIQIIQGDQELWTSLQKNKKLTYKMKIRVLEEGEYLISAYAFNRYSDDDDSGGFGDGETIYVYSGRNIAQVLSREDIRSQTPIGPCVNCSTLGVDPMFFEGD
ncbi:MAG: hypothetical protein E4G99_12450 [Anaerolineales bacterium]|nr:MAG: hypothetical protein E4G99_12450 [Anaerolineales bacterium]